MTCVPHGSRAEKRKERDQERDQEIKRSRERERDQEIKRSREINRERERAMERGRTDRDADKARRVGGAEGAMQRDDFPRLVKRTAGA